MAALSSQIAGFLASPQGRQILGGLSKSPSAAPLSPSLLSPSLLSPSLVSPSYTPAPTHHTLLWVLLALVLLAGSGLGVYVWYNRKKK